MNDKFKKVGIIGACLVAMIGSGACVSQYIENKKAYEEKRQEESAYFSMIKTKAEQPNAEPFYIWHYGNIILDKNARERLQLKLTEKQVDDLHHEYLTKAYNMGYISAKLQYADELMHHALGLHYNDVNLGLFEQAKILNKNELLQGLKLTSEVLQQTCKTRRYSEYAQLPNNDDYPYYENFSGQRLWWLTVFLKDNSNLTTDDEAWQTTASILLFGDSYCGEETYPLNAKSITLTEFSAMPFKEQVYSYAYARFINQSTNINTLLNQLPKNQKKNIILASDQVLARFYKIFGNYVINHPQRPKNHSEIENEAFKNIIITKDELTVLPPPSKSEN